MPKRKKVKLGETDERLNWTKEQLLDRILYLEGVLGLREDYATYVGRKANIPCEEFVHSTEARAWMADYVTRHGKRTLSATVVGLHRSQVFF
jgi:hypothetical protein